MSPPRRDDWIDDDEYPDDDDVEAFGEDSPLDDDRLTIGYVGDRRPQFWTLGRVILLLIVLTIVAALVLPSVIAALR
ncbi:MAG: hypothetical protein IPK19_38260 [Chloroflexi bacterium]|nr:hypothetical protein [Chloroflexota bacterium]